MEKIPYTMVLHKHADGADTRFATMARPLMKKPLEKWLGVIRRGTYKEESEYIRWAYEPVSDLWIDIEPDSDSSDNRSSVEGKEDQENLNDQEHEERRGG